MANTTEVLFATNRKLRTSKNGRIKKSWASLNDKSFVALPQGDFQLGTSQVKIVRRKLDRGQKVNDESKYKTARFLGASGVVGGSSNAPVKNSIYNSLLSSIEPPDSSNKSKRSILAFVPGFDYTFAESIERGALLAHVYGSSSHAFVPFVFSWPSLGQLSESAYPRDRQNARMSGKSMAGALLLFIDCIARLRSDDRSPASVNLLAHSMGAHALMHAVQSMSIGSYATKPFDRIILAAADVDYDALGSNEKLQPLEDLGKHVLVYVNGGDGPLHMAARRLGGSARLGCEGPSQATVGEFSVILDTIRCEDVDFGMHKQGQFGHQYYRMSPFVVYDIRRVLRGERADKIKRREPVKSQENVYRLIKPKKKWQNNRRHGSRMSGRGSR